MMGGVGHLVLWLNCSPLYLKRSDGNIAIVLLKKKTKLVKITKRLDFFVKIDIIKSKKV